MGGQSTRVPVEKRRGKVSTVLTFVGPSTNGVVQFVAIYLSLFGFIGTSCAACVRPVRLSVRCVGFHSLILGAMKHLLLLVLDKSVGGQSVLSYPP